MPQMPMIRDLSSWRKAWSWERYETMVKFAGGGSARTSCTPFGGSLVEKNAKFGVFNQRADFSKALHRAVVDEPRKGAIFTVSLDAADLLVNGGSLSQPISDFMSYCLAVPLGGADSVFDILDLASEMVQGFGELSNSGSGIPEISHFP
ncbi:hypothetical protein M5K25_004423 [Dendrobium thyrsiflorum]|uniref:Uncharacterized protein n=1 Tax=Dendrobium thyrsiflorum TaxID=117978 RepID=A0ABD0VLM8_DENTH